MNRPVAQDGSLEGVIVAESAIATVDGKRGVALIRGYSLPDIAAQRTYEDAAYLVLHGELPDGAQRARFRDALGAGAALTADDHALVAGLAKGRSHADALAAAIVLAEDAAALETSDLAERATRVLGRVPSVIAAVTGVPEPPDVESYAARALAALGGTRRDSAAVRALDVLISLESEHGLSASTFACRVAASSGANAGPTLAAGVATLSGTRHGGATAQALALLDRAAASGDPAEYVRKAHANRERLPGFGHRIYKVADPRVPPLRAAMQAMDNVRHLATVEAMRAAAEPLFGAKGVHANIDLYGAALLDALGVRSTEFVAAFAVGIACGWLAHWIEQRATGRLIRPDSAYTGPPARDVPANI